MKPEIMTVQEVSDYLRVSERTVYEWATQGTIPCGKLGTTWRFKRSEVEKWVDQHLSASQKNISYAPVLIGDLLSPDHTMILTAASKDEILSAMIHRLDETGAIQNKERVMEGIFQREKLMSTGIGLGIGIPHVRIEGIDRLLMAVGLAEKPITDYESLDGQPVRLLFMILAGANQHTLHIKTMAAISQRIKNPLLRASLFDARDETTIYDILTKDGR